jgi:hypothetical protein
LGLGREHHGRQANAKSFDRAAACGGLSHESGQFIELAMHNSSPVLRRHRIGAPVPPFHDFLHGWGMNLTTNVKLKWRLWNLANVLARFPS